MGKWQSIDKLFDGLHFDREVIVLCVRWYSAVGHSGYSAKLWEWTLLCGMASLRHGFDCDG